MPFLVLLLIPIMLIVFFAYHLLFSPHSNRSKMPVAEGTQGDQFELRSSMGVPYFFINNLPYPTHFEESRRDHQSLVGEWMFRNDPQDRGLKESWFKTGDANADSSGWEQITVPSVFNADSGDKDSYQGFSWYKKVFKRDSVSEGYWSRLCFEGVFFYSEVYLNGHKLCEKGGGYTPFYLNASDFLSINDDNVLVLRVDNSSNRKPTPPLHSKDHNPGWDTSDSISQNIYFETVPENYIFKAVASILNNGDRTKLGLDILIHSPHSTCRVDVTLIDPEGNSCGGTLFNAEFDESDRSPGLAVRGGHCELQLDNPQFWNPEDPVLYQVLIETASAGHSDRITFKTGL